ncbi:MAG: hypothetical protein ACRD3L_02875 [Terriglobales bacterium]
MRRSALYVFTMVFALSALATLTKVAAHQTQVVTSYRGQASDGAYRDGLFQGKIDATRGRQPHLTSGRWSTDLDRASFISGYRRGYRETHELYASNEAPPFAGTALRMGAGDGTADGARDRLGSKRFQASATANYRIANHGYSMEFGDPDQYRLSYREAYSNGYQQGYYGPHGEEEDGALNQPLKP